MTLTLRERLRRQFQTTAAPTGGVSSEAGADVGAANVEEHAPRPDDLIGEPIPTPATEPVPVASTSAPQVTGPQNQHQSFRPPAGGHRATIELSAIDQLKVDLHRRLVDRLDMEALESVKDERELASQIREAVTMFLAEEQVALSQSERDDIIDQIVYEVTGLGPIEPLFRDPTISDILVNGPRDIYVERQGSLSRVPTTFRNDAHLLAVIDRIVSRVGRRVDESSPMVDARLADGSRVNAIIPPLAIDGPVLSIRRFGSGLSMEQLIAQGALSKGMAMFLAGCIRAKVNLLISGGTGSGKTTLLNALSSFIPATERIITIEDAAELQLQQQHVVRLETRPPNVEGRGEVAPRDLIRNALRMRPNRIIVGEVRSAEVIDMLQAMNTGHEGSLATIHANTPRDALARLETMALMAGTNLPLRAMREQIASAIDIVVQVGRLSDGTRRIISITEVSSLKEEIVATQEVFSFQRYGVQDGRVLGQFAPAGIRPTVMDRLELAGITIPPSIFDDELQRELQRDDLPGDGRAPVDPEWTAVAGELAAFDADKARTLQHAEDLRQVEEQLQAERSRSAMLRDQLEVGQAMADALRAEVADLHQVAENAELAAAAKTEEIESLRARVLDLERPRDVRVGALLQFVDSADDLLRRAESASDPAWQECLNAFRTQLDGLLSSIGLESIASEGDQVDQLRHEIGGVGGEPKEGARVVRVARRGFSIGGRIVRRARVEVDEGRC
jgi:pilus assembly protein CpaF